MPPESTPAKTARCQAPPTGTASRGDGADPGQQPPQNRCCAIGRCRHPKRDPGLSKSCRERLRFYKNGGLDPACDPTRLCSQKNDTSTTWKEKLWLCVVTE
jgi:hypothetical protein